MSRVLSALGLPLLLALGQQQWLRSRPPHLERLAGAVASAGPASLEARFSRPMSVAALEQASRLDPPLRHRWLGRGDTVMLALATGQRVEGPLHLHLAGRDHRGLPLPSSDWRWDPRPRVVAVVPLPGGGEQLRLQEHDGRWRALTPALGQIPQVEALGDGSGVAFTSVDGQGRQQAWRLELHQRNLAPLSSPLAPVRPGRLQRLAGGANVLFAHLSADRRGSLLVQSGGLTPADGKLALWPPRGGPEILTLKASGPVRLLPEGGGLVVPESEGLSLQSLPPRPPRRELLPGSRDLVGFCPRAGRALLVRHWPDFRRSLELVEPGRSPRQLWIGPQAVVAASCGGGGERVWALLVEGLAQPTLTLVELDPRGSLRRSRRLEGWELEPGAGLHHDPTGDRLLTVLRPRSSIGTATAPPPPQVVLIDTAELEPRPLERTARQAVWLPPG
ncbi:hypothetical protein NZK32_04280 [Cyanobium sp. FGCU-52]|nr:hypothetical protein [Cyanobium sp. FGCU52]